VKRSIIILATILLIPVFAYADQERTRENFKQGLDAFVEGNYQLALKKWLPLAEKGHAEAQLNLSHMYIYGYGVK